MQKKVASEGVFRHATSKCNKYCFQQKNTICSLTIWLLPSFKDNFQRQFILLQVHNDKSSCIAHALLVEKQYIPREHDRGKYLIMDIRKPSSLHKIYPTA